MSEYTLRVTIACPETMIPQANQLALAVGQSANDNQTFGEPQYADSFGNRYAVASTLATEGFPQVAQSPLDQVVATKPWLLDREGNSLVDLALAEAAQDATQVYILTAPGGSVNPNTLTAVINPDPKAALDSMGLSRF